MTPAARNALLGLGSLWFPVAAAAGAVILRANRVEPSSVAGIATLAATFLPFALAWLAAALAARALPGRLALPLASGLLLTPGWGVVRWVNLHHLPGRSDPVSILANLGLLLLLLAAWGLLVALTHALSPLVARAPRRARALLAGLLLPAWAAGALALGLRAEETVASVHPDRTGARVCLVGIDGATWDVALPLIARGELPAFRRFMQEGFFGSMATLPLWSASPAMWTSAATGVLPARHGITFFVATVYDLPLGGRGIVIPSTPWSVPVARTLETLARLGVVRSQKAPVNGTMRRAPAVWEMAAAAGLRSLVLNWWASWPAEPVRGLMVSDMTDLLIARHFGVAEPGQGPEYLAEIPFLVHPPERRDEILNLLFREPAAERGAPGDAPLPPLDPENPASYVVNGRHSDEATLRLAESLLAAGESFDLACIYFRGLDWVEHYAWDALEPEFFPPGSPAARDPALAHAIEDYYRYVDGLLARLEAALGDSTTLLVVSDHGHRKAVPPGVDGDHRGTHHTWPRPDGILLAKGPGLRSNRRVMATGARLQDITPTLLYLLGVPLPKALDGGIITDLVEPDSLRARPARFVPSYPRLAAPGGLEGPGNEIDSQAVERLRSLGYLR